MRKTRCVWQSLLYLSFQTKSDGTNLEINTAFFINKEFDLKKAFKDLSQLYYKVSISPLDFSKADTAASAINKYIAQATKNRIVKFVSPSKFTADIIYYYYFTKRIFLYLFIFLADVKDAQVFLTSILYFKGQWKSPFNTSGTHRETFYDEKNNKIGEVDMMFQIGVLPYTRMEEIKAHVLELPYGQVSFHFKFSLSLIIF